MTARERIRAVLLRTAALLVIAGVMMLGWWQQCLVLTWLHFPCLTCGMTRSLQALLRLDWRASLRYHPLTILFAFTFWLLFNREPLGISERAMRRWAIVMGVLLVAFWLGRIVGGPEGWAFLLSGSSGR